MSKQCKYPRINDPIPPTYDELTAHIVEAVARMNRAQREGDIDAFNRFHDYAVAMRIYRQALAGVKRC